MLNSLGIPDNSRRQTFHLPQPHDRSYSTNGEHLCHPHLCGSYLGAQRSYLTSFIPQLQRAPDPGFPDTSFLTLNPFLHTPTCTRHPWRSEGRDGTTPTPILKSVIAPYALFLALNPQPQGPTEDDTAVPRPGQKLWESHRLCVSRPHPNHGLCPHTGVPQSTAYTRKTEEECAMPIRQTNQLRWLGDGPHTDFLKLLGG